MTDAHEDALAPLLSAAAVTDDLIGVAELTALWDVLGIADDALRDEFVDTVAALAAADMDSVENTDPELHLRLGHWKIDLARREGTSRHWRAVRRVCSPPPWLAMSSGA